MLVNKVVAMSMRKYILLIFILLDSLCMVSQENNIRVNQVGYCVGKEKKAFIIDGISSQFAIRDAQTKEVVYSGNVLVPNYCMLSQESICEIVFSDFNNEGTYYIQCGDVESYPFVIQQNGLYKDVSRAAIRAFYYWRASTELLSQHATWKSIDFSRPMGHPNTQVKIHSSAATENRPVGTIVSAPKGWYDAGDYNLYVVNAGISFHSLALAYELLPEYYVQLSLNLPESGNDVPDILNELMWELEWLFAMQDEDGGVYAKLSAMHFCSMVMPHEDTAERFMIGKSTAASLDFAAIMAMASRIFENYEKQFPHIAERALKAAEKAWRWAKQHPTEYFKNPVGVTTGGYMDSDVRDEFFWAASELYITTKDKKYYKELDFSLDFPVPEWGTVATLGLMSLVVHEEMIPENSEVLERYNALAQSIVESSISSHHGIPITKFNWGSNGVIAAAATIVGIAEKKMSVGNKEYLSVMRDAWNYLLGANPTGYCFVTGFGTKYPRHLHDRRCTADGIKEPIPGYIVGGATNIVLRDCGAKNYSSLAPAACYLDKVCSFSTNEIAINWNAPFAFLAGLMDAE